MDDNNGASPGQRIAGLALAWLAATAHAAGGHHAVDDATILARGECAGETWLTRYDGGTGLLHLGANCRVGPVELGVAGENLRVRDESSETQANLELKWARDLVEGFSVGFDVQPYRRMNGRPHYAMTTAYGIATWAPAMTWAFHANYGRDFVQGERDLPRAGVAAEWLPSRRLSYVVERYRENDTHFMRVGARWAAGRSWTIDLSRAQRIAGPVPSNWTIGLSIDLDDD